MKKQKFFPLAVQFLKYFATAGIATLCDWGAFWVFVNVLRINYLVSNVFAFIIWFILNYILSVRFVFKESKHDSRAKEIALVLGTSLLGLAVNMGCLYLLVDLMGFGELEYNGILYGAMLAKIIASGVSMVTNFALRRIFIFR